MRGAQAARSLSEVLWETLQDALAEHRTARVAELSGRLAEISLTVASLADAGKRPSSPRTPERSGQSRPERASALPPAHEPTRPHEPAGSTSEFTVASQAQSPSAAGLSPTSNQEPEPVSEASRSAESASGSERTPPSRSAAPFESLPVPPPASPQQGLGGDRERAVAAILVDELGAREPVETRSSPRDGAPTPGNIAIRDERAPAAKRGDATQAGPGEVGAEQGDTAQAGPGEVGAEQGDTAQAGPGEVGAEQGDTAQAGPGDVGAEQRDTAPQAAGQRDGERRYSAQGTAGHGSAEPAETDHARTRHGDTGQSPPSWIASIERHLERYRRDRHAFALLLLELADIQRLRHAELPGEIARLTTLVEAELSAQLRPADSLMRESLGRYWLVAPQTTGADAQALAAQLAEAVSRAASHRGAPLQLAVGIALCQQDALGARELVARAEVGLYEALATGQVLTTSEEPNARDRPVSSARAGADESDDPR
jgi:GGDEF domain-containing protein